MSGVPGGSPPAEELPRSLPRPAAYPAAVVLSGTAAVLGLGREMLVLERLGVSGANDALQLALSIVYTIALFGEPLRLASLNLLGRSLGPRLALLLGLLFVAVAAVTTLGYGRTGPGLPVPWLVAAGAGGAANLLLAWVLPRSLERGPFLPVHAVAVMPNILIVAGLLLPARDDQAFAERVVFLFLAAPVVQLVLLGLLARRGEPARNRGGEAGAAEAVGPIGWHAVAALGGMGTQYVIRSAALGAGPGALTVFAVALRVSDTIRAVLIDTYIASRIRRWAEGRRNTSALVDGRWLGSGLIALVGAAGLAVALFWPQPVRSETAVTLANAIAILLDPVALVLLVGLYFVLALRVRYQERNVAAQPLTMVRRIAGLEAGTALMVGAAALIGGLPLALLVWMAYVARPAFGLRLVAARSTEVTALAPEE